MLAGFVTWPPEDLQRWQKEGFRPGCRVADLVRRSASQHRDKVAVIDGARRITYGELVEQVDRLAVALHHHGLKPRDRVVLQLPNSIEFVVTFLALTRLGAIPVMALRAHRYSEIRYFVECASRGVKPEFCPPEQSSAAVKLTNLMVQSRKNNGERISCRI